MGKDIYITLDYELFLGLKTGSVENSLIMPMDELARTFDRHGVKATLFVDSSFLYALNKYRDRYSSLDKDYSRVAGQIKRLARNGHSIQLHIHPQWYFSEYNGNEWKLNMEFYKLSDVEHDLAVHYFKESKNLLESVIEKDIIGFRAGGYSIQTFKGYYDLMVTNNIRVDSSVLTGAVSHSRFQWYDYRTVPMDSPYCFEQDIARPSDKGEVMELPITTCRFNPVHYALLRKKSDEGSFKAFSDGSSVASALSRPRRMYDFYRQMFRTKIVPASIDSLSSYLLPLVYKKACEESGARSFVIIGHPKSASPKSIRLTDDFISNTVLNNEYKVIEDLLK
ncbi:hypothetical protein [Bacteroides sedimenti]|uniref:NodB homology domain-containing protein n=1 Tax=Bacteroides sedimenti TaxID=2136147 RepID=A0ABN6Z6E4_9BACE